MGMKESDERRRVAHICGGIVSAVLAVALAVDAAANDFRLKPTSPAFALGFKAWDYEAAGLRKPDR